MKVTENSTYRLMRTNLDRITNDLLGLRNQGATGLKLNKPSDDPGAIRPVLTTRTQLQQNARYLETMGQAGDKMAATDGHLAHVENILVRIKEIAINSNNSALSQSDLDTLADEVAELKNELLDAANAVVDGKYIFGGYQENTVPFTKNDSYDPALYNVNDVTTWPYIYNGDNNPTKLEITPGEFIATNLTGNELFMGITNQIAGTGYANPYQGQTLVSGPIGVGTLGNDITITPESGVPVTITGDPDLTDLVGENNYAGKVAALFSQSGTGLVGTANAATANLGSLSLTDFVDTEDTYSLDITTGGNSVSVTLDGPSGSYDYTLDGMASALANTSGATNLTPTSGTLSNGVNYDISSGSLVLTGPSDGSEIELAETITDGVVTGTVPAGGIAGGNQTAYGTINIATNSTTNVDIAGTGLASVGLTANSLDGASGKIDLFTVLTRTEEAIRAGNVNDINGPGGSIQSQLENLDIAADQNRTLRSQLGAKAKRVDTATLHQEDAQIDLKQILSRYQDADIIEVYNDIIQKETAFQAALNITSRVSKISILDYF
jgi:flagellar hook-associated protein 3 FlgL